MMTMTELFYGPVEPTWLAHPRIPTNGNCHSNPCTDYNDDTLSYRCNPYVQRNAVPNTVVAPSTQGLAYPYHARSCVHRGTAALAPVSTVYQQVEAIQSPAKQVQQSPGRPGVLQPRNVVNVQTVHFMVPLCCGKCVDRVKEKLLDLDGHVVFSQSSCFPICTDIKSLKPRSHMPELKTLNKLVTLILDNDVNANLQRVTSDQWKQRVSVTSTVAPEKLLRRAQKIKKRSTFWPQQEQAGAVQVSNNNQRPNPAANQFVNDENAPHTPSN